MDFGFMVRAGKDGIILGDWMAEYSNRTKELREMRLDMQVDADWRHTWLTAWPPQYSACPPRKLQLHRRLHWSSSVRRVVVSSDSPCRICGPE